MLHRLEQGLGTLLILIVLLGGLAKLAGSRKGDVLSFCGPVIVVLLVLV